jgi:hypothetical protein
MTGRGAEWAAACLSLESGAVLYLDRNYEALAEMLTFEPVRLPV